MYCEKNRGSKNRPNDSAFYLAWNYINSYPNHMFSGLSESEDAILSHILFSDYYLIYLFFDKPIFSKHQNIGTVFLPTVRQKREEIHTKGFDSMAIMQPLINESLHQQNIKPLDIAWCPLKPLKSPWNPWFKGFKAIKDFMAF